MRISLSAKLLATALLSAVLSAGHAANTGYLFISSEKDNSIIVLDGESLELVKTIQTAARPRHLQFSPDRSKIFAACGDGNAIDIIDVASLTLVDRISGIDDPEAFDFSPDGNTLYITLEDDGELGILDLPAYFAGRQEKPELDVAQPSAASDDGDDEDEDENEDSDGPAIAGLTTVEVGQEPEGILVNPDGSLVYVTSEVANIVHVIDTASETLTANIVVGNRPRRFALTPDQSELWVSNELAGSVTIIDPKTNSVLEEITFLPPGFRSENVTPVGITMTDDGATAIVALGRANHVAFVNVQSREIEDYVLVGKRAWNATLNRENSTLYVVNGLSDDVSIIDVDRRRVTKSFPVGRVPYALLIDD